MTRPFRLLIFAVCGVIGYAGAWAFIAPSTKWLAAKRNAGILQSPGDESRGRTEGAESLSAQWTAFRAQEGISAEDFARLYESLATIDDPFQRRVFHSLLIADWAATDPQSGLAFLISNDKLRVGPFAREWMRIDADAAVSALLAGGSEEIETLRSLLNDIARQAPGRLAQVANTLPNTNDSWNWETQTAFTTFSKSDLRSARAAAESITAPCRREALAGVAIAWAETDGAAAVEWAQSLPARDIRDAVVKSALKVFAKTEPVGALERLDLLPADSEREVLDAAARSDWDRTLQWMTEHSTRFGNGSGYALVNALSQRLAADPLGTMQEVVQREFPNT